MNPSSLLFAAMIAAIFAAAAWFIDWGAVRYGHWSRRKRLAMRGFMIALAAGFGLYTYVTDSQMRGTTLFEVAGKWEENADRIWQMTVEHPGVEHTLMVYPFVRGFKDASRPVTLRTRFGEQGQAPLIDDTADYKTVAKSGRSGGRTWDSETFRFVPSRAGTYELIVEYIGGEVPPSLHLRVTDPEKRDGKRAPGY